MSKHHDYGDRYRIIHYGSRLSGNDSLDAIRYLINNKNLFNKESFMEKKNFNVSQMVFSILYGYGEVLHVTPDNEFDSYPVEVVYGKETPDERVEFYDQDGVAMESDKKELFTNRLEAIRHIKDNFKKPIQYRKIFNLYDDGLCTHHEDEISAIAGETYESCHNKRKLVKRHMVEWSN